VLACGMFLDESLNSVRTRQIVRYTDGPRPFTYIPDRVVLDEFDDSSPRSAGVWTNVNIATNCVRV
jgi:hypothetical protein